MSTPVRLQKHIADLGICSRRKAEVLIAEGKVKVNGEIVTEMGVKVDPTKDKVIVEAIPAQSQTSVAKPVYIILNKPIDYITSTSDKQGRTVLSLLRKNNNVRPKFGRDITTRVYPVGRLDKDSEGLVLLTNDGDLTNKLTHPKYEHKKIYEVTIDKPLTKNTKKVLQKGMSIGDEAVRGIKIIKEFNKGKHTVVTVELKEGKNRQIRKMFGRLGYHVISLKRIQLGKLKLGTLPPGRWTFVKKDNVI